MLKRIHLAAALTATAIIACFWSATAVSELFGGEAAVVAVKQAILWGMLLLVPAIATTGATGFVIGGKWKAPLAVAKLRRMKFIAANGLMVLLPSAFFLAWRSAAGSFDGWFYAVQAIELVAGATNLALMGLNIRDGLALSRRIAGSRRDRPPAGFQAAAVKLSSKE
jgi:hypothetical protein